MSSIEERILMLLEAQGKTQQNLAYAVGVSQATISKYLKGSLNIKADMLIAISNYLCTSSDYLLGLTDCTRNVLIFNINGDIKAFTEVSLSKDDLNSVAHIIQKYDY